VTAAADRYDVIVVGGGQAGLALGYFLARDGRRFKILEAADVPAAAWRKRWDSLKLFTPVRYDSLPELPFPGDPDSYPGRDEVVVTWRATRSTSTCPCSSIARSSRSGPATMPASWSSCATAPTPLTK